MLRILYGNPLEYIEKNLGDDIFILPDSISIRNVEIYLLRKRGLEYFPAEKFFTVDSLAEKFFDKRYRIMPRFMERYICKESLKGIAFYRDLHESENFITLLLEEYLEIKENMVMGKMPNKIGEFFRVFNEEYSKFLDRLRDGVKVKGEIWHFLTRAEMTYLLASELSKMNGRKINFTGFYYISPTLKHLIDELRRNNYVTFISEPIDAESSIILEKRLMADRIDGEGLKKFKSELYELPDRRREVKFIANFILEKISQLGLSFSDFVVAFPDAKVYQWYVEEIFREYKIPYFIETRIKFPEMPYFNYFVEKIGKISPNDLNDLKNSLSNILQEIMIKFMDDSETILKMWQAIQEYFIEIEALSIKDANRAKELLLPFLYTVSFGRFYGNFNTVPIVDLGNVHFRKGIYLIIGGMSDEDFPRPLRGDIIFQNEASNIYKRDFRTHEGNEKYRLYSAIQNFQNIIFTYPYFNNDGKRVLQSYILDSIRVNGFSDFSIIRMGSTELIFNKGRIYSERDAKILNVNKNGNSEQNEFCSIEELRIKISNIDLTPSHITVYNKCPRKFFLMYVMEIKYPEEELSPAKRGSFAHDILRDFYKKYNDLHIISKMPENNLKKEIKDMVNGIKIEHDEGMAFKSRLSRQIYDAIKTDINISSERKVIGTELPFMIEIGNRKIRGRIDRLDSMQDYQILIDYKYSKYRDTLNMFIKKADELYNPEKDFNLPIYILWLLKVKKSKKFVAFYYPIVSMGRTSPGKWMRVYTNSATPKEFLSNNASFFYNNIFIENLENRIKEIIDGINRCQFPMTENKNICRNCEYRRICGGMNEL